MVYNADELALVFGGSGIETFASDAESAPGTFGGVSCCVGIGVAGGFGGAAGVFGKVGAAATSGIAGTAGVLGTAGTVGADAGAATETVGFFRAGR